jgi:WD40 repeat protein/S1-C subfamily serine protease
MSQGIVGHKVRCPSCRAVFRVTAAELKPAKEAGLAQAGSTLTRNRARLPAWAYAPLGFAAALLLIGVIVLARSFRSPASNPVAKPDAGSDQTDRSERSDRSDHAAARIRPRPTAADRSPGITESHVVENAPHPPAPTAATPAPTVGRTGSSPRAAPPESSISQSPPKATVARGESNESANKPNPLLFARGKKAIALLRMTCPDGEARRTAFCIDKAGLFVANADVVRRVVEGKGDLWLLVDIGLDTERSLGAKVLRVDDYLDLALLKIDGDPRLTTLELGKDQTLSETAPVLTFGFPVELNQRPEDAVRPARWLQRDGRTVMSGRITTLHGPREHLEGVQYDGQIDPGQFGGPVVDAAGKVIGVAVATIPKRSMNLAIPVGRLADFLAAPGVSFRPPALSYRDRSKPVSWSIKVEPATAGGKLPEGVSVHVTIAHTKGDRRTREAKVARDGSFQIEVTPVPSDPPTPVRAIEAVVEAKQGQVVLATVQRKIELEGAPAPPVAPANKSVEPEIFVIRVLRRPPLFGGYGPFIPGLGARDDPLLLFVPRMPPPSTPLPQTPPRIDRPGEGPSDEGLLTVNAPLYVAEFSAQGRSFHRWQVAPSTVSIGEARIVRKFWSFRFAGQTGRVHGDRAVDVAFAHDGSRMVSGSYDGTVRVWDRGGFHQRHVLSGHRGWVCAVALSPDGRKALSGGTDRVLRLWDIENGKLLREFEGHGDWILAVAFTADGRRALSAGGCREGFQPGTEKEIWVRDLDTGKVVGRWQGHDGIIGSLAVSPDGRFALSSSCDKTARLWDVETGRELKRFPGQTELGLHAIFSPDGQSAIVTSAAHLIRVFDLPGGRERLVLRGHVDKVDSLAASPDGRMLVSASWREQSFRIWDLKSGQPLGNWLLHANPQRGAFAPDGRLFWCFSDGSLGEYEFPNRATDWYSVEPSDGSEPSVRRLSAPVEDIAVGGDGRFLCLKLKGPVLAVFDVTAADFTKTIKLRSEKALIAAGSDLLVVAYPDQPAVERWSLTDLNSQGKRAPSPIRGRIQSLALGSDSEGPLIVVWSPSKNGGAPEQARFSFLDPETFTTLKVGEVTSDGSEGIVRVSPSGGSIVLHPTLRDRVHVRASPRGDLFTIWQTSSSPSGFQTLALRGRTLRTVYKPEAWGHLVPGYCPNQYLPGISIYTGRGGVRDSEGNVFRDRPEQFLPPASMITIPTDWVPCVGIVGLACSQYGNAVNGGGKVAALMHDPAHGRADFGVIDLDEMAPGASDESTIPIDFTVDKRFHFIRLADLLLTIPFSNDRLVLRRLGGSGPPVNRGVQRKSATGKAGSGKNTSGPR